MTQRSSDRVKEIGIEETSVSFGSGGLGGVRRGREG
jgi:hypothetical protein